MSDKLLFIERIVRMSHDELYELLASLTPEQFEDVVRRATDWAQAQKGYNPYHREVLQERWVEGILKWMEEQR